ALPPREAFLFILLANLANTAFCVIFWVIDIDKFFLPSFITFLFFTGVGVAVVWDWLAARLPRALPLLAQGTTALVFVGATGLMLTQNYSVNDFSGRTDVIETWQENLAQPLEKGAVIAGSWESITPLEYAMYVDGRRTDLERWKVIVQNYQLGQVPYGSRQTDIERAVRAGRPVYLTVYPGDTETLGALTNEFRLTRVGGLWRVVDLPKRDCGSQIADCGLPITESRAVFADSAGRSVELLGYSIYPTATLRAGDFALVTLFWRAPQSVSTRLTISLRLIDAQNRVIVQRDSEPASGLRPTIGWADNEIVQDDAGLLVPLDAAPGTYRLQIVLYNSATVQNLTTPGGEIFTLGELNIAPR
ncbi:MAG TPA: hypothetical protein VF429_01960, partial [Anaerolineae bacterium]